MQLKGTVAARSLWRSERTDAGDVCVSDRYSCKLGSSVALTRCVGSGRVLRALVVMDRFSRDRSPCLPLPPPFRTSPGHEDSSSDSLLRLIPLAVFVL